MFPALVPGPYTLQVKLQGFKPVEIKGNIVLANNRTAVGSLKLEVGGLEEVVTVTSQGQMLATTQTFCELQTSPVWQSVSSMQRPRHTPLRHSAPSGQSSPVAHSRSQR